MQLLFKILFTLIATVSVEAHFRVPFPGERNATNWATQTEGPCGGANREVLPRYEWNPQGSPIEITYHHTYGVGAIYFCGDDEEGDCTTGDEFNHLLYEPIDQTTGNYCIPAVQLPSEYNEINKTGVIQVVYASLGKTGGYEFMYNCIDVVVSNDGPEFSGQCSNSSDSQIDSEVQKIEDENVVQLSKISTFTYLNEHNSTTTSSDITSASTMDMNNMGGMNMSGMDMSDMGMESSTTLVSRLMSPSMIMSPSMTMSPSSIPSSTSSSTSSSILSTTSKADAGNLTPIYGGFFALLPLALL